MNTLAITGLGVVTPQGTGREAFFSAMRAGLAAGAAFGPPTIFDATHYPGACVAEVRDFDPAAWVGDKGLRTLDRLTKLFLVASRGAIEDAGIKHKGDYVAYSGPRVGICGSTAYGSLEAMMELNRVAVLENPRYLNPSKFPNTVINSALGYVSIWDDYRALNATVVNGNCGPLDAVLCAETWLSGGRADAVLVGGAEAMHEGLYLAFDRLESLVTVDRPYSPGDPASAGMRLGEGASLMVLERADAARARGARLYAEVLGYGTAFEPPESEALLVHVSPFAIASAIQAALDDAGVRGQQIDLVLSSCNGLPLFDGAEFIALERTLGSRVCVLAPKAAFGEMLGASAAISMAAALAWIADAPLATLVRGEPPTEVRYVLVTAVGFYGNVSAVVMRRPL